MKINNLKGYEVNINPSKYAVDWDRKVSKPQLKVKKIIQPFWSSKMVCEEFCIPSSRLRIDLVNLSDKVVIEVSPSSTHSQYNPFFNKNRSNFLAARKRDMQKVKWCLDNGFTYIEINGDDLKKSDEEILEIILNYEEEN